MSLLLKNPYPGMKAWNRNNMQLELDIVAKKPD